MTTTTTTTTETGTDRSFMTPGTTALVELLLAVHNHQGAAALALLPGAWIDPSAARDELRQADNALTELAARLLPAVAAAMGEDLDALADTRDDDPGAEEAAWALDAALSRS